MTDKLSDHASPKCKDRVKMIENEDKKVCLDPKAKKGAAICVGHALLRSGKAKNKSEAMKMGHKKVKKVCD